MRFGGGWRNRLLLSDKTSYRLLLACTSLSALLAGVMAFRTVTTGFTPLQLWREGDDEEKEYTVRSKYFSRSEKGLGTQERSVFDEAVERAIEEQREERDQEATRQK